MFYNASAYENVLDSELRGFLEYVSDSQIKTPFTEKIDSLVVENKSNSLWENEYMYFSDYVEEIKEQLKVVYKEEGLAEKSFEIAKNMIKKGNFSAEDISELTGLSLEKVKTLQLENA